MREFSSVADQHHNTLDLAWDYLTRGELARAEMLCRKILSAPKGRTSQAWTMLGIALREQRKAAEAESAYRRAIALSPSDAYAHHNLGALLSAQDRPEEALKHLNLAQSLGLNATELYVNRGRTFVQLYRLDDAEQAYARAVLVEARDAVAQSVLAQLRYMRGDQEFARDLIKAARLYPNHAALQLTLSELQRRTDDFQGAEATLIALRSRGVDGLELDLALGRIYLEAGDATKALNQTEKLLREKPGDSKVADLVVSAMLSSGRAQEALQHLGLCRVREPQNQRWLAYEATADRILGRPHYRELYDYSRFVRTYPVETPKGWASMGEFHESLITALRKRQVFKTHPLDQSLRHGTQTARNLLTDSDPIIQALIAAFVAPVKEYLQSIDVGRGHALHLSEARDFRFGGCWSVDLHDRGFHLNHVHPEGRISSAYHVEVPSTAADVVKKPGWIKFGEPGMRIAGLNAEHYVQPKPGRLVLFPSYMWHGTNSIGEGESRLTVAFDAVQ